MTTPSGTISLNDVNVELGLAGTTNINMNQTNVRTLAGVPSGTISMQNLQNKSNRTVVSLIISSTVTNYDVYANRGPSYVAGKSDVTVTVYPGVFVGTGGGYAMAVPSAFSPADTVTIVNYGTIIGHYGQGGAGGPAATPATANPGGAGGQGGSALYLNRPTTVNNLGVIAGGGGGGGGGGGTARSARNATYASSGGGGGGGAGYVSGGAGGAGSASSPVNVSYGVPGGNGDTVNGGYGGSGGARPGGGGGGPGGVGGGRGAYGAPGASGTNPGAGAIGAGGSGGAPGYYIVGNGYASWVNYGTLQGFAA